MSHTSHENPDQIPIIQCTYQLNLEALRISATLPVSYRHTLGTFLAHQSSQFFTQVIQANLNQNAKEKSLAIEELKTRSSGALHDHSVPQGFEAYLLLQAC